MFLERTKEELTLKRYVDHYAYDEDGFDRVSLKVEILEKIGSVKLSLSNLNSEMENTKRILKALVLHAGLEDIEEESL